MARASVLQRGEERRRWEKRRLAKCAEVTRTWSRGPDVSGDIERAWRSGVGGSVDGSVKFSSVGRSVGIDKKERTTALWG